MKLKIADEDEIDINTITSHLEFLGDDTSPAITNNYEENSGLDGSIATFSTFNKTTVTANFALKFGDYYDFTLAKHDIYAAFMNKKLMRIRTDAEPYIVKYVRAGNFEIKPTEDRSHLALFSIPFDNPSGYKYSMLRSDYLNAFSEDGWQFGMNIPSDADLSYHFKTSKFSIYNASDIPIDPYYQRHDLKIIIQFKGDSLQLTNETTNTSWKYEKPSDGVETIILDGINTSLNGNPASANTDYGNLTLNKGWNSIVAAGATTVDITFSFPFIYLG